MNKQHHPGERAPYNSKGGKPAAAQTSRGLQILLGLPLVLALFALVLQEQLAGVIPSDSGPKPGSKHTPKHALATLSAADVNWDVNGINPAGPKVAFCVTTAESPRQIRHWIAYHRLIGVGTFYLFVDGSANTPSVIHELAGMPGVTVIPRDEKIKAQQAKSRVWNETWLSAFFHKPCNHELFVLQSLNMEVAIDMATKDGIDWLLHIDTDELVHPSAPGVFNLQQLLNAQPKDVNLVVFPNYESLPEHENVVDPFIEVTLFKKNYDHVISDMYFKYYSTVAHNNPNYFITYGNGKSAARIIPGLRSNGAHRFHNYFINPKEVQSEEAAILHYTYTRFSDLRGRRDRCDCAPTEKDVERCFILPFDREAFMASSLKDEAELQRWFKERLVWDDPQVVTEMIKAGLFTRISLPQVLMKHIVLKAEREDNATVGAPGGKAAAGEMSIVGANNGTV